MRRILAPILLLSSLGTISVAAQEAALPLADLVAEAGAQIASQCVRLLDEPPSTSELAQRAAEMSKTVFCDCMPPALESLKSARAPTTPIGGDEFRVLVLHEFDTCGARAVRETTRRDCAKFTPPNAPPTYCECFANAVDALTDQEIVDDSIASGVNLEQRRDARRNSAPEPPLGETLLARIDRQCRATAPAQ
jgi:hypothetical protein